MVSLVHRSVAAALLAAVAAALTTPACAAPTGHRAVERQVPLALTRTPLRIPHGTAVAVPPVFAPLLDARSAQRAAPIEALTLVPPIRSSTFPALLPVGLAALNAAWLDTDRCSSARSPMLLTRLPVQPFAPAACARAASLAGSGDRATTLVPGRNKNALYGPAYSLHEFDAP